MNNTGTQKLDNSDQNDSALAIIIMQFLALPW